MSRFTIREPWVRERIQAEQARPADSTSVTELLRQTASWLQSKGSTQWSGLLTGEDVHGTSDAIARGDVFIFRDVEAGKLAGVVILLTTPSPWDLELWDSVDDHNTAIYLHRLAINRDYAGTGLGEAMMRWAANGIHFEGKDRIRLDCIATNETLYQFYSSLGYVHQGTHPNGFHCFEQHLPTL
ncbi:GNAT family N-acetyltransferase [Paenibacillus sp. GCM10027629]|uniref:GNAT family N-acetyltransferase n=1 Tax=Paenibacillus sp. GCM10027629 TaxID=3273414 RepID=UPI00363B28BD